ncbi:chemotaxis protein [Lawsonia intracellularis]|uniref:Chemotaxis signal transduction protein n=1 Tax=Lawsonia intracellularis (strain PHE/MN1-00) TaxID=363253 RepID=Q1MQE4_LAWIP|nr:chemotaxis protein [Lawsonia intracellularis]AGC50150.1 chemotaxis signal transduction protein [Lawsonia intracellularis N343]KAA0204847.1 chemotaxis protein CheV [Lawsonia intracellularis]MBZ3892591.1 chemotaxis protein [Lawsonia intracellularis]OMQ03211.1 chemotaxis protein CheV [Lawsonia intracellularis]RBN33239.1 chemotaxis protein CheV [Lawsonia intracellularis]
MSQTGILLESGTNELEIVEFFLDEDDDNGEVYRGYYGVNVAKVLEIIRMPKVTELPDTQDESILGAFNLRSHVIPLVDLGHWLGKKLAKTDEPKKVIVTEFNDVTTSFMVSGVNRIHRISWDEVEPPNDYVSQVSKTTITGIITIEDRIVFILDLEKIVAELNPALSLRLDEAVTWGSEIRYRALIADDSNLIREMLKDLMQKANFEVEAVNNGREAWERLTELKNRATEENKNITDYVQAVITDIEMPSMDGLNLCKRIKEDPQLRKLPVVLFSSIITDKLRHKGIDVGADDQISKPEVTHLAKRVYALIAERQS